MILDGRTLTPGAVEAVARGGEQVELSGEARERNAAAAQALDELVAGGEQVYGVTTGVGPFRTHPVPEDQRGDQQLRLLRSHASGGGRGAAAGARPRGDGGAGEPDRSGRRGRVRGAARRARGRAERERDSGGARDRLAWDRRPHGARGDRAGPDRPLSAGTRIARRARLHEQQRGIDRPRRARRGRGRSPARRRSGGGRPVIPRARMPTGSCSTSACTRRGHIRARSAVAARLRELLAADAVASQALGGAPPSRIRSRSARCRRSRAPRATR